MLSNQKQVLLVVLLCMLVLLGWLVWHRKQVPIISSASGSFLSEKSSWSLLAADVQDFVQASKRPNSSWTSGYPVPEEPYRSLFVADMQEVVRTYEEQYGPVPEGVILPQITFYGDLISVPCNRIGAYVLIARCEGTPAMELRCAFQVDVQFDDTKTPRQTIGDYQLTQVELTELWYFSE